MAVRLTAMGVVSFLLAGNAIADGRFVDDDAALGGDGLTWNTAYRFLQDALDEAGSNDAINGSRVAQGTYKPDEDEGGNVILGDRGATFTMANGVHVSGGYRGLSGGGEPDDHDHDACVTILSGDIGTPDNNSDNSYHVVNGSAVTSPTKLVGCTITSGNADQGIPEDHPNSRAGGLYIEAGNVFPVFCRFTDNSAARGGAIYIREIGQAGRVARCTFDNNTADSFGGGFGGAIMIIATSSPIIAQCRFTNNYSPAGGAIYMSNECDPKIVDCLFANNSSFNGGAMLIGNGSNPRIRSCTIVENSASVVGGGVLVTRVTSAEPTFDNCVIWDNSDSSGGGKEAQIYSDHSSDTQNPVVNSTCILGGWSGLGGAGPRRATTGPA